VIVECPACHTRYRINDSATLNESTLFECTQDRCREVFPCAPELFNGDPRQESEGHFPVDILQANDDADRDEPFVVPPVPHQLAPSPPAHTKALSPPPQPKVPVSAPPVQPTVQPPSDFFEDEEEGFSLMGEEEEEKEEKPPVAALTVPFPTKPRIYMRPEAPPRESAPSRKQLQPTEEPTLSLKVIFAFLGSLLLGYTFLSLYGRLNIESTEAILARLPLIGPRFIASQFSAQHITLSDLKSSLAVTKDSKRILAIAGKATNTAPVPASIIQIEGTLYDSTGKVLGQQQTFCGTETAVETLSNLTTREIGILQRLAPPKQFAVASGQSISFLIVFVNPPATVTELGGRVLTVQFRTPN
jgi:Protein of unknown function (DUF3426)